MTTSPSSSTLVTVTSTRVSTASAGPVSSEALLAMALMTTLYVLSDVSSGVPSASGVAVLSPDLSFGSSKSGEFTNWSTPPLMVKKEASAPLRSQLMLAPSGSVPT